MALYLSEQDVEALLPMPDAINALESCFVAQADGAAINQPRRRLYMPSGTYHTMAAADLSLGTFGQKAYASFPPHTRFLFLLYSAANGDLLAVIQADRLGQIRTGAASGLAAARLARPDAGLKVGIYGAGWQARSQLQAICAVRSVEQITVSSRNAENRKVFCVEMAQQLGCAVVPAERPEQAAEGQDIIVTATTSSDPVLRGDWLSPGVHISAVGSNMLTKREIDETAIVRSDLVFVDSIEQARCEAGDFLPALERRKFRWEQAHELHELVSGRHPGRTNPDQITLFKSNGIALEDVAVATHVYRQAAVRKMGALLPPDLQ